MFFIVTAFGNFDSGYRCCYLRGKKLQYVIISGCLSLKWSKCMSVVTSQESEMRCNRCRSVLCERLAPGRCTKVKRLWAFWSWVHCLNHYTLSAEWLVPWPYLLTHMASVVSRCRSVLCCVPEQYVEQVISPPWQRNDNPLPVAITVLCSD